MKKDIKSGQEVIHDFLSDVLNIPSADPAIIDVLVRLYRDDKLTDKSLQAAVDQLIQDKIAASDE
jgi:hypothetical protein